MIDLTKIYYFIFGALTIAGGVMGYVKKHSHVSLIAGGLCGVLLLMAGVMLRDKPQTGLALGGAVSLALVGWSLYNFFPKHKMMPHGMILGFGVLAIVLTAVSFAKK